MVALGYKHGPFDFRYRVPRKLATPVWELRPDRDGPRRLDWSHFLVRFFPTRRRHDFEALAAYEGYRNAFDEAAATREAASTRLPLPALATWEAEGGSLGGSRTIPV